MTLTDRWNADVKAERLRGDRWAMGQARQAAKRAALVEADRKRAAKTALLRAQMIAYRNASESA